MRMRPVRHFSRALHQVSVCVRKSARHSQVRSPNMRTSQHIVAASVRVVPICSSKSWLTRTNATGRNDLQTANTLIPRKQSCSRYAAIDDFSCTETQADGSNFEGIPKDFSFGFLDLFDLFDLFADLARASLGFLERPSRLCEVVRVRMDCTIGQRPH